MNIKLDENLGNRCITLLREAGHDVATVVEEELAGTDDNSLISVCSGERRCLLTLDLDFSNPLRFPPADYSGIAVIRLPAKPSYEDLSRASVFGFCADHGDVQLSASPLECLFAGAEEDVDPIG